MFASAKLVAFVVAATVLGANAQSSAAPTTTAGISQCVIDCSTQAAASEGCSSFADLQCVCTNAAFQAAANACLTANCTASDLTAALTLQDSECQNIPGAVSATFPASSATSAASAASSAASSASSAGSSESAAGSSASSAASSAAKAASSASAGKSSASSAASSASSAASSASSAGSSAQQTTTNTSNAATSVVQLNLHAFMGVGVAIACAFAGVALVL